jgi:hypothetical protein
LTVLVDILELEPLATVRVTVVDPAVANAWLGFWAVLVVPSPKFHCQEVGDPVEVSENCTACPAIGAAGEKVKEDDSTDMDATVSVWLPYFGPELEPAVSVTV